MITHKFKHNGKEYFMSMAKCDGTTFGIEDHGIWTAMISVIIGGGGTSIGGYRLDDGGKGTAAGLDWLLRAIRVIDPSYLAAWENLKGKSFFTVHEEEHDWSGYATKGIVSLDGKQVFMFDDWRKEWFDNKS